MTEMDIKVSIGMPVYNDKEFLSKALNSILSQTFSDFELIISDDGSTDGSEDICKKYAQVDNRIIYIRQEKNLGISKNMEFVLSKAKGEYFMWAANDDLWAEDFIEKLLNKLKLNPKAIVAFSPYTLIDEDDNIINKQHVIIEDFNADYAYLRLRKFLSNMSDGFGYGLFRRKMIADVKFPVWWGINRTTPFNNIYPTLFFYLSRGQYELYNNNRLLWYNRTKKTGEPNHKLPYPNSFIKAYFAFVLRKFNLACVSISSIYRGSKNVGLTIKMTPYIFYSLFFIRIINIRKKRKEFKKKGSLIFI